jgi:hypothetical protein
MPYKNVSDRQVRDRERNGTIPGRWVQLKKNAKQRSIACTISYSEFVCLISSAICYYCDRSLCATGHGLDRVFVEQGYESGNCVPCCKDCNFRKGRLEVAGLLTPAEIYLLMGRVRELSDPRIFK